MRVYIAGPMTGLPDFNFPAFAEAAAYWRGKGFDVVSPSEVNPDHSTAWAECMRRDIAALVTCDGICLLPGWEASRGAQLERSIAMALGMPTVHHAEYQLPEAQAAPGSRAVGSGPIATDRHTPGPWDVSCGAIWGTSPFNARVKLATVTEFAPMNGIDHAANACLIAAAPELLAALQEAIRAVKVFHGPADWEIYSQHSPEMRRWRAVIAKAGSQATEEVAP